MSAVQAKMQGGPMHNKYMAVPTYEDRVNIKAPAQTPRSWFEQEVWQPMLTKEGHYSKSNKRLKNGTVIFIWMGWRE